VARGRARATESRLPNGGTPVPAHPRIPAVNRRDPTPPFVCGRPRLADDGRTLGPNDAPPDPAALRGPFALGLAEAPGAGASPWLAVDRFARETLCYSFEGGVLRAAPRADTLATAGAPALEPQALFDYLFFHAIPSPTTVFRGVHRLPPGHTARVQGGRVQVRPYWRPRFAPARPAPSFDAAKAEFRRLLEQAVARELDGGKPGCFLSGGTDSSTVAGLVGVVAGRAAATFSIGFEAEGYDEMAFARIAARHFGTEHHEYYVTPDDLVAHIPQVAAAYDQPFGNSSALPAFCCARLAREKGLTRILAGDGGDELFGGNSRYAKQRVFDRYQQVPAPLRAGLIEPLVGIDALQGLTLFRKGRSYVEQAREPMPVRTHLYNLLMRLGVDEVLEPGFLRAVDRSEPGRRQTEVWNAADAADALNRELAYDWRFTLAESDLPKVRETTRLAGLEVGFPMLDEDLLEFSMRLPVEWKLKGQQLRWFFKEALRGFLPDEILVKKKQGFGLPFGVWATRHAGLRALAEDSLGQLATRGLVRPAFVRTLLTEKLAQHPGYYGEMVWILMMLEQWLRAHAPDWRFEA